MLLLYVYKLILFIFNIDEENYSFYFIDIFFFSVVYFQIELFVEDINDVIDLNLELILMMLICDGIVWIVFFKS